MPILLLEVLFGGQPIECAEFYLYEGAEAREWIRSKIEFYSPVVIDMMATVKAHGEYSAYMPEFHHSLAVN